jgi:ankyrin repeat protein
MQQSNSSEMLDISKKNDDNCRQLISLITHTESNISEIIKFIDESGVNINCKYGNLQHKNTPLINATLFKPQIVRYLLENGADPNIPESGTGRTPLAIAVSKKNIEIMELLFANRIPIMIDSVDKEGHTPLFWAVANSKKDELDYKIISFLLKKGANPNKLFNGSSPLYYAVLKKDSKIIDILLEHGADINKENINGDTPISLAERSDPFLFKKLSDYISLKGIRMINEYPNLENNIGFDSLSDLYEFSQPPKGGKRRKTSKKGRKPSKKKRKTVKKRRKYKKA